MPNGVAAAMNGCHLSRFGCACGGVGVFLCCSYVVCCFCCCSQLRCRSGPSSSSPLPLSGPRGVTSIFFRNDAIARAAYEENLHSKTPNSFSQLVQQYIIAFPPGLTNQTFMPKMDWPGFLGNPNLTLQGTTHNSASTSTATDQALYRT